MSVRTARTFACAADLLARSLKLRYDGTAIASRMPRMMMTTRSSIRVKPCSPPARAFKRSIIGGASPSAEGWEERPMYRDKSPIAPHPYGGFLTQTHHPPWVSLRGTQGSGGPCRCLGRGTMHDQLASIDGLLEQMM